MCDLFAMSSPRSMGAQMALPVFGVRARKNVDGWGIGYFHRGQARVEKSSQRIYRPGQLHDSFQRLSRVVASPLIISHIRHQTSGKIDECHSHPFVLSFRGTNWLFAHNGTSKPMESYRTTGEQIEDAVSDSARTFEFIRDSLLLYLEKDEYTLFEALARSLVRMLERFPGTYNIFLANPNALFAFSNHRQFMFFKGSKKLEGELLITTIQEGLSDEGWVRMERPEDKRGLLLYISSGDIIIKDVI